jgi:hypothetical protein
MKNTNSVQKKRDIVSYDTSLKQNYPPLTKEFSSFLNIIEIDTFIKNKIEYEYEHKLVIYEKQLDMEMKKLQKKLFEIEKINIENDIKFLEKEINDIKERVKINEYINETKDIINLYKDIGPKKKVITFSMSKTEKKQDMNDNKEQLYLIEKFISIAKYYHEINLIYPPKKLICEGCGANLQKIFSDDSGCCICPICGVEKTVLVQNIIISENKGNNMKEGYEDRENFEKALHRFQGKQVNQPPKKLYSELDEYFMSFNPPLPTGDIIRKLPLQQNGSKKGTSRSMIIKALSETGNSVFYDDVNLISHLYWGWALPDLSADEDKIMNDYDITQEIYKKIPKDRKSSLNTQYRLWQHLKIRGYNYPIDVFKIVKTPDIIAEHDRIMEIMCKEAGLPFSPAL